MYKSLLIATTIITAQSVNCAASSQSQLIHRKASALDPVTDSSEELRQVIATREEARRKYLNWIECAQIDAYELAEEGIDYTKHAPEPCLIALHRHMDRVTPTHLKTLFNNHLTELAPSFVCIQQHLHDAYDKTPHDCNKEKAANKHYAGSMTSFILGCLPLFTQTCSNSHEVFQSWANNLPETFCNFSLAGLGIAGCIYCCRHASLAASEGQLEAEVCKNSALNAIAPISSTTDNE